MLDPISYSIEVPCSQENAFAVFVEMQSWWPLDKRSVSAMEGKHPKSLSLEAKAGGKIVEIAFDDKEHLWGTVRSYNPYTEFSMDFHMGLPAVDPASLVEIHFTSLEEELTQVTLTQSNWEAFGDLAEMMRGGYGSSWGLIFEEAYKLACSK